MKVELDRTKQELMRTKTETGVLREKEKELVISKSLAEKLKTSLHDKESKIVDLESRCRL